MNARTPDVSRNGEGKEKLVVAEQAKDVVASQGRESVAVAAKRADQRQMGVLQRLGGFGSALAKRLESAMVYAGNDILNAPGDAVRAGKKVAKAYDDVTQWAGETIRGAGNMAKDVAAGAVDIGWQATRGALYDIPKGTVEAGAAFAGKLVEDAANDIKEAPATAMRAGKKGVKAAGDVLDVYNDGAQWAGETIRGAGNMAKDVAVGAADIGWQATRGAVYDIPKGALEAGAAFAGKLVEDAANDIKEAPATAMRAGKKVAKAYDDVTQKIGEGIVDTAKGAGTIASEMAKFAYKETAPVVAAPFELAAMGVKKGFEVGVDAINYAAQDLVDAPATAKCAVERTFTWLDKLAARLTAPGEKAAVEKVAKSMRTLEARAGGARAERAAAADTAATRLLERLRAMPQTSRGDETTAARILSDIRARAELQRRAELHLQEDVMSAK